MSSAQVRDNRDLIFITIEMPINNRDTPDHEGYGLGNDNEDEILVSSNLPHNVTTIILILS